MKEQLLALLTENFPEVDFTASDALVDDGILESIVLVEIISTISLEMGILIPCLLYTSPSPRDRG